MTHEFTRLSRRGILGLAFSASAVGLAFHAATAADAAAIVPIERLNAALLATMKAGRTQPFEQRLASLSSVIDQTFDLDTVLATSVGLTWPSLPEDQKTALRAAFNRYTVASYAASFDNFTGQTFQVSPNVRAVANGDVVVQTKLVDSDGPVMPLDYVMRQGPSGWRVVDVLAGGSISRVAVQRSDFRSLLASGGVPALMSALQRKVADLRAA
jgi:phospholipid transport system substrate-binding protein